MTEAKVAAVVITHGPHPDLDACLRVLGDQVDELAVVANLPGPLRGLPASTTVVRNPRPVGFAANANRGVAATTAPFVIIANPDAVADPGAVAALTEFLVDHPQAGIAGPEMRYPDGTWQPSRRRFPTVLGTVIRRTPLRLLLRDPAGTARTTTSTTARPAPCALTGCSAASCACAGRCSTTWVGSTRAIASTARTSTWGTPPTSRGGSRGTCPKRRWSTATPQ